MFPEPMAMMKNSSVKTVPVVSTDETLSPLTDHIARGTKLRPTTRHNPIVSLYTVMPFVRFAIANQLLLFFLSTPGSTRSSLSTLCLFDRPKKRIFNVLVVAISKVECGVSQCSNKDIGDALGRCCIGCGHGGELW